MFFVTIVPKSINSGCDKLSYALEWKLVLMDLV